MRIPRIYYPHSFSINANVELSGQLHHYVAHVLRLVPNNQLRLFNDKGEEYFCRITHISRHIVELVCESRVETLPESPLRLEIFLAIGKNTSMDFSLQKSTELGVSAIHPVITEYTAHTDSLSNSVMQKKIMHWEGVVRSASEQCGRVVVPTLYTPRALADIHSPKAAVLLALVPGSQDTLRKRLGDLSGAGICSAIGLFIGSEGGLSKHDLSTLTQRGFEQVNLGVRILRAETAVVSAVTLAQAMLGDLR